MADRGRDLKIGILSDATKFDLSDPADQLQEVGDNAKGMGQDVDKATDELKRLALQGKDAQDELDRLNKEAKSNDLDRLAKDAKDTAGKVDSSFERIAASSKSNLKKVDDSAHDAGEGLDEFKDEAKSTSKEAAASFTDITSALDAVQEIAANAFAGFGPAGMAAGAAAAVGIGLLSSSLQKSADEANATKQRVIDLSQAIDEAGGDLSKVDISGMMRDWSREIADNKSWWEVWQKANTTNLEQVKQQADETGLSFSDMFKGMSGLDADAAQRVLDQINDKLAENERALDTGKRAVSDFTGAQDAFGKSTESLVFSTDAHTSSLRDTNAALLKKKDVLQQAIDQQHLLEEALGTSAEEEQRAKQAIEDHAAAYADFVDPAGTYTDLLADMQAKEQESAQKTADATESKKDSWEDYAKSVDVSVDDYIKALEKQVTAQEQWATNLQTLAKRGVDEGVLAELEKMGPQGAPLIAKLTHASDAELAKTVSLFQRKGAASGQGYASNLVNQTGAVSASAQRVHDAAAVQLARAITVPVRLEDATYAARLAWGEADAYFRNHPITIRTNKGAGGRPIRDVP